jgi:PLP dependent protein
VTNGPADPGVPDDARRAELAGNLEAVRERIASACAAAGRPADEVTLVAITKTFPYTDVMALASLGLTDFGENRDQEAAPKAAECARLGLLPHWHFVGQLQVNKVASVTRYADYVHSVDRLRLVRSLGSHASSAGRQVTCLIQVSLEEPAEVSPSGGRGGASPAEVAELADAIAGQDALILGGVMAVAPLGTSPRAAFARLREVADRVRADHRSAMVISAGMSGDLDDAIAEGATHVRVGTALLGGRPPFVR